MDAARAAAMSDPERNPNFRRRWQEGPPPLADALREDQPERLGTIGRALLGAWRRQQVRREGTAP